MTEEDIIRSWKSGLTVIAVSEEYMRLRNKELERKKEKKITIQDAMKFVEPIIYKYETKDWRKG